MLLGDATANIKGVCELSRTVKTTNGKVIKLNFKNVQLLEDMDYFIEKYLGIDMKYSTGVIGLNQETYIDALKEKFIGSEGISAKIKSPLLKLLTPIDENTEPAKLPYRQIVGALLYISTTTSICTRPDISFTVMQPFEQILNTILIRTLRSSNKMFEVFG